VPNSRLSIFDPPDLLWQAEPSTDKDKDDSFNAKAIAPANGKPWPDVHVTESGPCRGQSLTAFPFWIDQVIVFGASNYDRNVACR